MRRCPSASATSSLKGPSGRPTADYREEQIRNRCPTAIPHPQAGRTTHCDARIIMGNDKAALLRLWREKRGETGPEDLSGNLIVQLGLATEALNRR